MQDIFICHVCGKNIYIPCVADWCYKKNLDGKNAYGCTWTCFNKIEVRQSRVKPYENEQIKKELEGFYGSLPVKDKKKLANLVEEMEYKRRDIERDMRKKGAWIQ